MNLPIIIACANYFSIQELFCNYITKFVWRNESLRSNTVSRNKFILNIVSFQGKWNKQPLLESVEGECLHYRVVSCLTGQYLDSRDRSSRSQQTRALSVRGDRNTSQTSLQISASSPGVLPLDARLYANICMSSARRGTEQSHVTSL